MNIVIKVVSSFPEIITKLIYLSFIICRSYCRCYNRKERLRGKFNTQLLLDHTSRKKSTDTIVSQIHTNFLLCIAKTIIPLILNVVS